MVAEGRINPFPGLRPFEADEDHLFFGRERQIDELLRRLRATRFLAVVGTSGSGKSSLVRSGLVPSLYSGFMVQAGSRWRVAAFRPGEDPIGHMAAALDDPDVLGSPGELGDTRRVSLEATLRRSSSGLFEAVRQAWLPSGEKVLLIVDQFEELFRFHRNRRLRSSHDESVAFVKLLLRAAQQAAVPVYVVLTMRSDFIGDCMTYPGLPEAVNDGQYLVPRMTRDELRSAIAGPVAVAGGEIASRLVTRLLNDVGEDPDQLPVLQHALMRTWAHWDRADQPGQPMDLPDYEAIGTMKEALSRHAEEAYADVGEEDRHATEVLFRALTDTVSDSRGVRRPTSVEEIARDRGAARRPCDRGRGSLPPAGPQLSHAAARRRARLALRPRHLAREPHARVGAPHRVGGAGARGGRVLRAPRPRRRLARAGHGGTVARPRAGARAAVARGEPPEQGVGGSLRWGLRPRRRVPRAQRGGAQPRRRARRARAAPEAAPRVAGRRGPRRAPRAVDRDGSVRAAAATPRRRAVRPGRRQPESRKDGCRRDADVRRPAVGPRGRRGPRVRGVQAGAAGEGTALLRGVRRAEARQRGAAAGDRARTFPAWRHLPSAAPPRRGASALRRGVPAVLGARTAPSGEPRVPTVARQRPELARRAASAPGRRGPRGGGGLRAGAVAPDRAPRGVPGGRRLPARARSDALQPRHSPVGARRRRGRRLSRSHQPPDAAGQAGAPLGPTGTGPGAEQLRVAPEARAALRGGAGGDRARDRDPRGLDPW